MDNDQIKRAVVALQQFVTKQHAAKAQSDLFHDDAQDVISIQLALKAIPDKSPSKLRSMALPHSIRQDEHVEMCLFVKDDAKPAIKAALRDNPVVGLTKIMTLKKLKSHYRQFEDKRKLVASYDLFLADDRILSCLAKPLGKTFFAKKKQPTAVTIARKGTLVSGPTLAKSLEAAKHATHFRLPTGPNVSIKAALTTMPVDDSVENIQAILAQCSSSTAHHIPRGWKNIQAVYLKTTDSVALPVYTTLPGGGMKIPRATAREPESEDGTTAQQHAAVCESPPPMTKRRKM